MLVEQTILKFSRMNGGHNSHDDDTILSMKPNTSLLTLDRLTIGGAPLGGLYCGLLFCVISDFFNSASHQQKRFEF
jgi:hypothetical protein